MDKNIYDCIIVGGGHAGIEAFYSLLIRANNSRFKSYINYNK